MCLQRARATGRTGKKFGQRTGRPTFWAPDTSLPSPSAKKLGFRLPVYNRGTRVPAPGQGTEAAGQPMPAVTWVLGLQGRPVAGARLPVCSRRPVRCLPFDAAPPSCSPRRPRTAPRAASARTGPRLRERQARAAACVQEAPPCTVTAARAHPRFAPALSLQGPPREPSSLALREAQASPACLNASESIQGGELAGQGAGGGHGARAALNKHGSRTVSLA